MLAFRHGDAAGLAALYTEHGQLLPTQSEVIEGKLGIQSFWQGVMDMGITAAHLETLEAEDHGDTAHEVGQYTLEGAGGHVRDRGKYVVIWKHAGGQWKLHRDIWNSSMPPAGQ
jgi:ketosteroid isomerase-like protein